MLIHNCLTPKEQLVTAQPHTPIREVIQLLKHHRLDSLPIVNQYQCFFGVAGYGSILKTSIREKRPLDQCLDQPIRIAIEPIQGVSLDSNFEEILPQIVRHPFVPVTDEDGIFLGIAKISNIEQALSHTFGVDVKGTRLLIGVFNDHPRLLERLLEVLRPFLVNIISLTTFDAGKHAARRILLKLSPSPYIRQIIDKLEGTGFRVLRYREVDC